MVGELAANRDLAIILVVLDSCVPHDMPKGFLCPVLVPDSFISTSSKSLKQ